MLSADRLSEDLKKDTPIGEDKNTATRTTKFRLYAHEDAWRNNFSIDWKKQTDLGDYNLRYYETTYSSDVNFLASTLVIYDGTTRLSRQPYFDFLKRKDRVVEASMGRMLYDNHYLNFGIDYHDESGEGSRISVPGSPVRTLSRLFVMPNPSDPDNPVKRTSSVNVTDASLNYYSAYLMDDWQMGKKLLVIPSLRYTNHNKFGAHVSPSIGATYKARSNVRIKTNIGTSFATPGIAELYHDWEMYEPSLNQKPPFRNGWLFEGNPNLKPEKAINMDVSVEAELGKKTSAKLTLFRNDFKDYMQIVYAGEKESKNLNGFTRHNWYAKYPKQDGWEYYEYDDVVDALKNASTWEEKDDILFEQTDYAKGISAMDDVYTYKNVAKARTEGLEAEITHEPTRDFSIKAGYTYLDARDRQTNKRLEGRGRHMLNFTMMYNDRKHGWRATFWGDYTRNYLDIRDRIATGRIFDKDGNVMSADKIIPEHHTIIEEGTGKEIHIFKNKDDAKKYVELKDNVHTYSHEKIAREKNYGLWSLMVEKDIMRGGTLYAGVTNLFNQYDPYLGMGGRIYRFGMRMSF